MSKSPPASERSPLASKIYQRGVHDCPSCGFKLSSLAASCPRCHCHFETLDSFLNKEGPKLTTVMDFADLLDGQDGDIKASISSIERKFPSLKLMFCSVVCPDGTQPSTLGWWMLNKGIHSSPPSWSGLLLLDPSSHQVTFQTGYDLEVFINRQKLEFLLSECGEWFTLKDWSGGVSNFFTELHPMLRQAYQEALKTRKEALRALNKK